MVNSEVERQCVVVRQSSMRQKAVVRKTVVSNAKISETEFSEAVGISEAVVWQ